MSVKHGLKLLLVNVGVALLLLALIEGASGLALLCADLARSGNVDLAERFHTTYDPDLGWVNIPNTHIPDFYGPGKEIRINGQGFRSDHDFGEKVPGGKVRIMATGDSFTLGFGVSGKNAWPSRLAAHHGALESVNMGQGGYGVDQMYLWYMRDGIKYDHDIHLFAFIGEDFARMLHDNLEGFAKPYLKYENGAVVTCNTPVPRAAYRLAWLTRNREAFARLSTARLAARLAWRQRGEGVPAANKELLVEALFANVARVDRAKGSTLVLVWLPTSDNAAYDDLRSGIRYLCGKNGWHFVDLTDEMEQRGENSRLMFIPDDGTQPAFLNAAGHYSEEGNRVIAAALYRRLGLIPEIAAKIPPPD